MPPLGYTCAVGPKEKLYVRLRRRLMVYGIPFLGARVVFVSKAELFLWKAFIIKVDDVSANQKIKQQC